VRIEGHTSTFWDNAKSPLDAYMKNMALSQARTRSTLAYVLSIEAIAPQRDWLIARLTANGLSSSRPIAAVSSTGLTTIDNRASQRVEFRIVTNAEDRMARIAEAIKR
jgi:outer membrane protein OmpA-like peptidoglycan-associated protein